MGLIPESSIKALRALKAMGYSDQAIRRVKSTVVGGYSYGKASYADGQTFPCRVVFKPSPDLLPGADVEMTDAELFFSRDFTLLPDDHVMITHIHGDKVEGLEYEIVSGPILTSVGKEATLKLYKG